jgi:hypothetical protein
MIKSIFSAILSTVHSALMGVALIGLVWIGPLLLAYGFGPGVMVASGGGVLALGGAYLFVEMWTRTRSSWAFVSLSREMREAQPHR